MSQDKKISQDRQIRTNNQTSQNKEIDSSKQESQDKKIDLTKQASKDKETHQDTKISPLSHCLALKAQAARKVTTRS